MKNTIRKIMTGNVAWDDLIYDVICNVALFLFTNGHCVCQYPDQPVYFSAVSQMRPFLLRPPISAMRQRP